MYKYLSPTLGNSETAALASCQNLNIRLSDSILKVFNYLLLTPLNHWNFWLSQSCFWSPRWKKRFEPQSPHHTSLFFRFLSPCKPSSCWTELPRALLVVVPFLPGADYPFILLEPSLAPDPGQSSWNTSPGFYSLLRNWNFKSAGARSPETSAFRRKGCLPPPWQKSTELLQFFQLCKAQGDAGTALPDEVFLIGCVCDVQ